jgi:hypothetical protein
MVRIVIREDQNLQFSDLGVEVGVGEATLIGKGGPLASKSQVGYREDFLIPIYWIKKFNTNNSRAACRNLIWV